MGRLAVVRWSSCWSRISPAQIEQNVVLLSTSTRMWMCLTMCICSVNVWCLLLGYFMLCVGDSKADIFLVFSGLCVCTVLCLCVCVGRRLPGWSNCWAGVWIWGQMTGGCLGWVLVSKDSSEADDRHGRNYSGSSVISREYFFMPISFCLELLCYSPWLKPDFGNTLTNLYFHTLKYFFIPFIPLQLHYAC